MNSRIYTGWLRHRRERPHTHTFAYRLFMMYLDLAELDQVFAGRWLWSAHRPAPARFDRRDHLGDPGVDLETSVRSLVAEQIGRRPRGPICLLTHLRYFGYCMNPVSFYYCWDEQQRNIEAVVAEINNTPWRERHCYVLATADDCQHRFSKSFHVSPFMGMAQEYRWRLSRPGDTLAVNMQNFESDQRIFNATLCLRAQPIDGPRLSRALVRYPMMTGKVAAAIYWQAFKLWCKGTPFLEHPGADVSRDRSKAQVSR